MSGNLRGSVAETPVISSVECVFMNSEITVNLSWVSIWIIFINWV